MAGDTPAQAPPPGPGPPPRVLQPRLPAPARSPRRRGPPRAILNALMSLAVIVLERRIRKALRSGAGTGGQPA
jgi:hypothetical protein